MWQGEGKGQGDICGEGELAPCRHPLTCVPCASAGRMCRPRQLLLFVVRLSALMALAAVFVWLYHEDEGVEDAA